MTPCGQGVKRALGTGAHGGVAGLRGAATPRPSPARPRYPFSAAAPFLPSSDRAAEEVRALRFAAFAFARWAAALPLPFVAAMVARSLSTLRRKRAAPFPVARIRTTKSAP